MDSVYEQIKSFKKQYKSTVAWRIKQHSKVIEKHLNPYTFLAITPDMFNDLTVYSGLIWGKIYIDTVKETVILSNISKSALDDIETPITEYMMNEKKKYIQNEQDS